MNHKYQLVLQLPEDSPLMSLDIEDDIAEALGNPLDDPSFPHFVDGNAYGGGTTEFFIHTDDPLAAFELIRPLWESQNLMDSTTAAYREFSGGDFVVFWPADHRGDFVI